MLKIKTSCYAQKAEFSTQNKIKRHRRIKGLSRQFCFSMNDNTKALKKFDLRTWCIKKKLFGYRLVHHMLLQMTNFSGGCKVCTLHKARFWSVETIFRLQDDKNYVAFESLVKISQVQNCMWSKSERKNAGNTRHFWRRNCRF